MERGAKKPLMQRLAENVVWSVIVSLLYIAGLTLLIPLVFLFVFPQEMDIVSPSTSPILVWTAVGLILASFFITLTFKKSLGGALKSLGRVTFIPGLIGLVFSLVGRDLVLLYMAGTIPGFNQLKPLLSLYLDNAVPHVRYLTLGFFVLGVVFWLLGDKLEADATIIKARQTVRRVGL